MAPRIGARLHVLLAPKARLGVVLRRGPSKAVCSIRWDLDRDTFETGQWLRGRIYERRSDLSPDGRFMIYFAMNGKWQTEIGGSWTAISRAPWLKAVALFGKGDCWNGGGLFTGKRSYWLNEGHEQHRLMTPSSAVLRDMAYQPPATYGGECPGVYYVRLQRDGWTCLGGDKYARGADWTIFEKRLPKGWILRKLAHEGLNRRPGRGCYWDEHELEHPATRSRLQFPEWEWADMDRGTVVWAEHGRLFRAPVEARKGVGNPILLKDFNNMEFKATPAPY